MSVKSGSRLSPVPMRQPSISRGWYRIFFRPCRMTWTRWAKLATARLARTPRLSTDQIPSTGLRSGARRELEHAQPCLGSGEGAQLGAEMDVEVIPDQDDDPAGQLAVGGDQQVPVLTPGERLGLALALTAMVPLGIRGGVSRKRCPASVGLSPVLSSPRSEEHTSELQSLRHLVC